MNGNLVRVAGCLISVEDVIGVGPVWLEALEEFGELADVHLSGGSVLRVPASVEQVEAALGAFGVRVHTPDPVLRDGETLTVAPSVGGGVAGEYPPPPVGGVPCAGCDHVATAHGPHGCRSSRVTYGAGDGGIEDVGLCGCPVFEMPD